MSWKTQVRDHMAAAPQALNVRLYCYRTCSLGGEGKICDLESFLVAFFPQSSASKHSEETLTTSPATLQASTARQHKIHATNGDRKSEEHSDARSERLRILHPF